MSPIGSFHRELSQLALKFSLEVFASGQVQEHVQAALDKNGRGLQRASPLQPLLSLWLILSMPLFRFESIPAVLGRLLNGLRAFVFGLSLRPVTDGAIAHARHRIGVGPVRDFFRLQAAEVRPEPSFHGMRVWIIDGSHLTMPDTPKNRKVFGLPKTPRGRAAFPQVKLVGLQDAVSRRFRDVRFGLWDTPERPAAQVMLQHLNRGDLVLLDRGFYAVWMFEELQQRGIHFIVRVSSKVKLKPIRGTFKRTGDYLAMVEARVALPAGEIRKPPVGRPARTRKVRLLVRVIEYRIRGFEHVRLVTDLLDARAVPALEVALEYHVRWDVEMGLDELKVHQSTHEGGACKTILRSKKPRLVMQEAYALFAAYNLVRSTIACAAKTHGLKPGEISFVDSLRVMGHMLPRMKGARTRDLPVLYEQLLQDIAECKLDRPRRPRRYPRVVKVKMSNYKLKRPQHRQETLDIRKLIRIGA